MVLTTQMVMATSMLTPGTRSTVIYFESHVRPHRDVNMPFLEGGCISSPILHAKNEQDAAGTAFAIAYESDINKVC